MGPAINVSRRTDFREAFVFFPLCTVRSACAEGLIDPRINRDSHLLIKMRRVKRSLFSTTEIRDIHRIRDLTAFQIFFLLNKDCLFNLFVSLLRFTSSIEFFFRKEVDVFFHKASVKISLIFGGAILFIPLHFLTLTLYLYFSLAPRYSVIDLNYLSFLLHSNTDEFLEKSLQTSSKIK